jgi:ubiquinone/menaquinone biosynthesis C-methylase UbiE
MRADRRTLPARLSRSGAVAAILVAAFWNLAGSPSRVAWGAPPLAQSPGGSARIVDRPPPPLTEYRGRKIAQTMHYTGAPWLIRDEREREERASAMLSALGIQAGQTVCDLGCGNGFHTLQLARLVGPGGRVLAVDIQPEMLRLLQKRARDAGVANIEPILGLPHDPKLPEGKLDLILLVDVYHDFSHPEHMLRAMRRALKREGRIALVEFRAEDPKVPIKPEHKMSKTQILKEFPPNGFKLSGEYDKLPWQHLMFFTGEETTTGGPAD